MFKVSAINAVLGTRSGVLRLILGLVFQLLPHKDLKNCVLVCRLWRDVGEVPRFWTWVKILVTRENMSAMAERLSSKRMRDVKNLRVKEWENVSEEVLHAAVSHRGLKKAQLAFVNLISVDPDILGNLVTRLEEVDMTGARMTTDQIQESFTRIGDERSFLKCFHISCNNLSIVNSSKLASALKMLKDVRIHDTQLNMEQLNVIMTTICAKETALKRLDISGNDLSGVDSKLLANAVNTVEEVKIMQTHLTVHQVEAIMTSICNGHSLLKKLDISYNDLSSVNPGLMAHALSCLKEARIALAMLNWAQMEAIEIQKQSTNDIDKKWLNIFSGINGFEGFDSYLFQELDSNPIF